MSYSENEARKQISQINLFTEVEDGIWKNRNGHILKDGRKNLYKGIREPALKYFYKNKIGWWNVGYEPTGNVLSSQVACINHLFALRNDADAVLKIINGINGTDNFFAKVIDIPSAYDVKEKEKEKKQNIKAYIAFEVVSKYDHLDEVSKYDHLDEVSKYDHLDEVSKYDHLDEVSKYDHLDEVSKHDHLDEVSKHDHLDEDRIRTRGANYTSIDALVYAQDTNGKKWIIPIEWKYTEKFSSKKQPEIKIKNYIGLIDCKSNLKEASISNYIQDTYYQLMRQTLWAEQIVNHRKKGGKKPHESFEAQYYLHLHVIPNKNKSFRKNGETKKTWKSKLNNPNKYIVIDPQKLFKPIREDDKLSKKYSDLIDYLNCRYWM